MTDKPTGPAAAARELWEPLKKVFQAANLTPDPNMEMNIEAIIEKHCLQDKRLSRWLLEIVNEILETQDPYSERGLNYSVVPKKLLQQLRAIYTGLEHCPEDKAVGGLVDALQEIRVVFVNTMQIVDAALAEYEMVEKLTTEDKGAELLLEACMEFVRKVECGEALSKRSYAQMKAAIAEYERVKK